LISLVLVDCQGIYLFIEHPHRCSPILILPLVEIIILRILMLPVFRLFGRVLVLVIRLKGFMTLRITISIIIYYGLCALIATMIILPRLLLKIYHPVSNFVYSRVVIPFRIFASSEDLLGSLVLVCISRGLLRKLLQHDVLRGLAECIHPAGWWGKPVS